jgi:hypothetical protein
LKPAPAPPKGNRRAVKHGASAQPSPQRQARVEQDICDALPIRAADGGAPTHDLVTVRLLSIAICRLESVSEYVSRHGSFYNTGKLRPAAEHEARLIERCTTLASKLGLDPASRARMNLDLVHGQVSLAQLMSDHSEGRRTRPRPDDIDGTAT